MTPAAAAGAGRAIAWMSLPSASGTPYRLASPSGREGDPVTDDRERIRRLTERVSCAG